VSTDSRSSSLPPPRFPKRGYDLLVDHDGRVFRYFVPDPGKGPGFFHELRPGEVAEQFERVLLRRNPTLPVLIAASALLVLVFSMGWTRLALVLIPLFALGVAWLAAYSRKARQMRIWYNHERPGIAARFEGLGRISQTLQASQRVWMVLTELPGTPGTPCSLRPADVGRLASTPPGLRIASPKGRFYLLPDGILAWKRRVVSFGPYEAWHNRSGPIQMAFSGSVPEDSPQRGQRHQHVTRIGRPDPKFSKNPVLPVVELGELVWGLGRSEMHLRTSRPEAAAQVAGELQGLAGQQAIEVPSRPTSSGTPG
jgi:hypothetical protein